MSRESRGRSRDTIREVAGVFRIREELDAAVDSLLLAGFDRADIDVLAGVDAIRQKLGTVYVRAEELADSPRAPRRPFFGPEDITAVEALAAAVIGFMFAALGSMPIALSGGSTAAAVAAAVIFGVVGGGLTTLFVGRYFRRQRESEFEAQAITGGLVLWIRTRSPEREALAKEILHARGATAVRTHVIDRESLAEDTQTGSAESDEWVASHRLGRP